MKKKNLPYNDELIRRFIEWLKKQPKINKTKNIKVNKDLKYTEKTIIAYVDRLNRFCNKFFSSGDISPFKELARNIEIPMICCCLSTSLSEPDEMLKPEEIKLLANIFLHHTAKINERTLDSRIIKDHFFERMVIYLCQKDLGVQYQRVIELFFEFLKGTSYERNSTLYDEIEKKLDIVRAACGVNLKYGYIEATQTTPAIIIPKAGQIGITVPALAEIFKCDRRTIYAMLKKGKISCCHHRKGSKSISDLNTYFRQQHTGLTNKDQREIRFTSRQEAIIFETYNAVLADIQKLQKIDVELSDSQKKNKKIEIMKKINERLLEYKDEINKKFSHWKTATETANQMNKKIWTVHRYGKNGKIPSTRYFKRKISYFCD